MVCCVRCVQIAVFLKNLPLLFYLKHIVKIIDNESREISQLEMLISVSGFIVVLSLLRTIIATLYVVLVCLKHCSKKLQILFQLIFSTLGFCIIHIL
jgi:hypothetical protein